MFANRPSSLSVHSKNLIRSVTVRYHAVNKTKLSLRTNIFIGISEIRKSLCLLWMNLDAQLCRCWFIPFVSLCLLKLRHYKWSYRLQLVQLPSLAGDWCWIDSNLHQADPWLISLPLPKLHTSTKGTNSIQLFICLLFFCRANMEVNTINFLTTD